MCRIHWSEVRKGFVLVCIFRCMGSSGLSTCNIACERFLMHRCDYLLIITPIYVVIMCRISMQTRGGGVVVP